MVNFKHQLREIDSMYPLLSTRHVLEDSLSFPTVCGMLMDIFLQKNGNRDTVLAVEASVASWIFDLDLDSVAVLRQQGCYDSSLSPAGGNMAGRAKRLREREQSMGAEKMGNGCPNMPLFLDEWSNGHFGYQADS